MKQAAIETYSFEYSGNDALLSNGKVVLHLTGPEAKKFTNNLMEIDEATEDEQSLKHNINTLIAQYFIDKTSEGPGFKQAAGPMCKETLLTHGYELKATTDDGTRKYVHPNGSSVSVNPDREWKLYSAKDGKYDQGEGGEKLDRILDEIHPKPETPPSCWGCGNDYRHKWKASDLVAMSAPNSKIRGFLCPDCHEDLRYQSTGGPSSERDDDWEKQYGPTHCGNYGCKKRLDEVNWIDPDTGLCNECLEPTLEYDHSQGMHEGQYDERCPDCCNLTHNQPTHKASNKYAFAVTEGHENDLECPEAFFEPERLPGHGKQAARKQKVLPKAQLLISPECRKNAGEPVRVTGFWGEGGTEIAQAVKAANEKCKQTSIVARMQFILGELHAAGFNVSAQPFPFPDLLGLSEEDGLIELTVGAKDPKGVGSGYEKQSAKRLLFDGMVADQKAAEAKIVTLRGQFTSRVPGEVIRYLKGDEVIAYFLPVDNWLTIQPPGATRFASKTVPEMFLVTMLQSWRDRLPKAIRAVMGPDAITQQGYGDGSTSWKVALYNTKNLSLESFNDALRKTLGGSSSDEGDDYRSGGGFSGYLEIEEFDEEASERQEQEEYLRQMEEDQI